MSIPSEIKLYTKDSGLRRIQVPGGAKETSTGEVYMQCPFCTSTRTEKNQNKKPFSFNTRNNGWRCKHCGEAGHILSDLEYEQRYVKPLGQHRSRGKLAPIENAGIYKWFKNKRGFSQKTVDYLGIQTARRMLNIKNHPNKELIGKKQIRTAIAYPFIYHGQLVDVQYRDMYKNFSMEVQADKVFYNIDKLSKGATYVIITEGMNDTAAFIEAGEYEVISVPNGISLSDREKQEYEQTGKYSRLGTANLNYVTKCYDDLTGKDIILATDADAAGVKLRYELMRRFGKERCKYIDFSVVTAANGKPCKDANQVLLEHGKEVLLKLKENAKFPEDEEIYEIGNNLDRLVDNYSMGKVKGIPLGVAGLDNRFSVRLGHTVALNGYSNQGKTTFACWLMMICILDPKINYTWGVFSPENYPVEDFIDILVEIYLGNTLDKNIKGHITIGEYRRAVKFLSDKVYIIDREDGFTPAALRAKRKELMQRYGCNAFVSDPWNALTEEYSTNPHKWLTRELSAEQRFGKQYNIYNLIATHPPTPKKKNDKGGYDHPTMFEIDGGKIWHSKMYDQLCVNRESLDNPDNTNTEVFVQKIKFQKLCGVPNYDSNPIMIRFLRRSNRFLDSQGKDRIAELIIAAEKKQQTVIDEFELTM